MKAEDLWKVSTGKGIKGAVISTGLNPATPALRGQVLTGVDASVRSGNVKGSVTDTTDTTGAGTTAAELIAGTGRGGGLQGLAPGAKIIPIRVPPVAHDDAPHINYPLATAVKAAVGSGAQIIYFSINNQFPLNNVFGDSGAFEYAVKKGALLIAGTGDVAKLGNKPQYPVAFSEVVGVAAADRSGKVAPTSQHGERPRLPWCGPSTPRGLLRKFGAFLRKLLAVTGRTPSALTSVTVWFALGRASWTARANLGVPIRIAIHSSCARSPEPRAPRRAPQKVRNRCARQRTPLRPLRRTPPTATPACPWRALPLRLPWLCWLEARQPGAGTASATLTTGRPASVRLADCRAKAV